VNDPHAQEIIKTSKITAEEAEKIANLLASIRVSGIKPKNS
jgi:hypothetical protein